jgi:hypothetical protein
MKTIAIILLSIFVTGCAATKGVTEVKIPVAVACKTEEPNQPTYRFSPPYPTVFEGVRDLMGDREIALAYENELRTALKSCK